VTSSTLGQYRTAVFETFAGDLNLSRLPSLQNIKVRSEENGLCPRRERRWCAVRITAMNFSLPWCHKIKLRLARTLAPQLSLERNCVDEKDK